MSNENIIQYSTDDSTTVYERIASQGQMKDSEDIALLLRQLVM
jgi:hypothetical protein